MENAPSPLNNANISYGRPSTPEANDTPAQASAKRFAIRQWYLARREAGRVRRTRRAQARAEQSTGGKTSFDVMGRWAIEQVVSRETDPISRRRRRVYLTRRWRNFMQQTFRNNTM